MTSLRPEDVKVLPPNPYVFRAVWKRRLMLLIDLMGGLLLSSRKPKPIVWGQVSKIAVLRLDHLGDVILALPFIEELKKAAPQAEIDFYVGPWAEAAVELSQLPVRTVIFPARWFDRSANKQGAKGVGELTNALKVGRYDLAFDLRGDLRHALAMWKAGVPQRVGYGLTGGKFLFTQPVQYKGTMHETDRNLDLLTQIGVGVKKGKIPRFYPDEAAQKRTLEVKKQLGLTRPIIALHATCGASAKRWPIEYWRELIAKLPVDHDLVMIGTEGEKKDMEEILEGVERKVFVAGGSLDLPALAAFLTDARLLIGVDSGPAHVAVAVGTSVVSIFSGTNQVEQWAPRGKAVKVVQCKTPCSPCALTVCPFGNECTKGLEVDEVLKLAESSLAV